MTAPVYVSCDLHITGSWADGFSVAADIDGYRVTEPLELPDAWDETELGIWLADLREAAEGLSRDDVAADHEAMADEFGKKIFDAVVNDKIAREYGIHRRQGDAIRLRLNIDAAELHGVPWEFMCDSETGIRLTTNEETPVVRTFGTSATRGRPPVPEQLNVLVMEAKEAVAPDGAEPGLDTAGEVAAIEAELGTVANITVTRVEPSVEALDAALAAGTYHAFHFVGHGEYSTRGGRGELLLGTNEDGTEDRVSATVLANTLGTHSSLRLVVLNACESSRSSERDPQSGMAQKLFAGGIDAVVAMQYQIVDQSAAAFASTMYREIADREPIDLAVTRARRAIQATTDWATPVLFMRTGDGTLFDEPAAAPPVREAEGTDTSPEPDSAARPVQAVAPVEPSTAAESTPPKPAMPEPVHEGGGRGPLVIAGVAALVVVLAAIGFLATRGGGDDDVATDTAASSSAPADDDAGTGDETSGADGDGSDGASAEGSESKTPTGTGYVLPDPVVDDLLADDRLFTAEDAGVPVDFVAWYWLVAGECVDWGPGQDAGFDAGYWNVIVPCTGEHNADVFGVEYIYDLDTEEPDAWPGEERLSTLAKDRCDDLYEELWGEGRDDDITAQIPTRDDWDIGESQTVCFLQGAPPGEGAVAG